VDTLHYAQLQGFDVQAILTAVKVHVLHELAEKP